MEAAEKGKLDAVTSKRVDAWMSQYAISKTEIGAQIGFYKGHVRNFQLVLGAVVGGGAFIASNPTLRPTSINFAAWYFAVLAIPIIATYLVMDIIGPVYIINLIAERMVVLERRLNEILGRRVYVAETYASSKLHSSVRPLPGVINPDAFLWFFGMIIYGAVSAGPGIWLLSYFFRSPTLSQGRLAWPWILSCVAVVVFCWTIVAFTAKNLSTSRPKIRVFMFDIADPNKPEPWEQQAK